MLWQSNRQAYFKKFVSQKLGTVYTLKEYYTNKYLVKDQNIKNVFSTDKFTYEEQAKIIEGKQVYNFRKTNSKNRIRRRVRR